MEFDQVIFKRIYNFLIRKKSSEYGTSDCCVVMEDIRSRLLFIARAITSDAIDVFGSEREGGWKGTVFYLPRESRLFDTVELNIKFFIYRVFYLSKQRELGFNWSFVSVAEAGQSQQKALEASGEVLDALFEEYPLLQPLHDDLKQRLINKARNTEESPDLTWLYGRWMKSSAQPELSALQSIPEEISVSPIKPKTELKARQADEVEVVPVEKKAQEDYVLTHNFEKVETIDEFNGVWRDFDGDDSLKDDAEALSDHNLRHMVRVDDPVHSVYQAEMATNTIVAESGAIQTAQYHLTYPEWDYSIQAYKSAFCKVFPEQFSQSNAGYYKMTIKYNHSVFTRLRKVFARINNDLEVVRRQLQGEHIDVDAAVDRFNDLQAKLAPDDRVYLSSRRQRKELSLLFLLDLSLSSDSYAKGNRIIDVEKQVSILFGEVLDEYGIDFQIDGFYSKTRNKTNYVTLKAFHQPWSRAKLNIGAVQPQGYTRIGPAIRHASHLLKQRKNRKKWLVLLSDGKPNDYDRYEGKYGVKDIKQALRELHSDGINSYAVAIEERAKYYLPQMFGANHYNILSSPVDMVNSLTKLYQRIEQG